MKRLSALMVAGLVLVALANATPPALAATADSIMENAKQKDVPPGPPQKSNKLDPNAPVSRPNIVCPVSNASITV